MSKALLYWTAAALLAVGLIAMHRFSGAWVPMLFPELNRSITDPTPLSLGAKGFMMIYLVLSVAAPVGVVLCVCAALSERDRRRWAVREQASPMKRRNNGTCWGARTWVQIANSGSITTRTKLGRRHRNDNQNRAFEQAGFGVL
jgi:hypothetical protein